MSMGIDLPDPSTADDQFRIPTCEEMGKYRHTMSMGIDLPDPSTADDQFRIPTCEEMGKYRHTVSMQSVVVVTLLTL